MSKNGIIALIVGIIIIAGGALIWSSSKSEAATGSVVVSIADATTQINNVSKINMTVDKVEVHSQAQGWTTVSSDSKTYDLLALHAQGKLAYYAKVDVPADNYDQVRVTLGDVKINDSTNATLPSHTILVSNAVKVNEKQTASIKLDFIANESLHQTANGSFVFAPVVKYESKSNADVKVQDEDSVSVTNGDETSNGSVGVDEHGESKADFMIDEKADLNVDANGMVTTGGDSNENMDNTHASTSGNVKGSVIPKNLLPIKGSTSESDNTNTSEGGVIKY